MPSEPRKPFWLIPNLLSLDAPLIAVTWLYIFARTWRADYLPWAAYISLALVVWVIYATDRILDGSIRFGSGEKLSARHEFHRTHRHVLRFVIIVAFVIALFVVISSLAVKIYIYAVLGAIMVGGFFTLAVYAPPSQQEIPYAKNILAGLSFGYGTAILAYAYTGFEIQDLIHSRELICFIMLCILNITAIDLWENANRSNDVEVKATNELALTLPLTLLGAAALVFAVQDPDLTTRPFFYAILTGSALLQVLNRSRSRFGPEALRVLADVTLLIPVVIFQVSSK